MFAFVYKMDWIIYDWLCMNPNSILLAAGMGDSTYIVSTIVIILAIGAFLRFVVFANTPEEYKHNHND